MKRRLLLIFIVLAIADMTLVGCTQIEDEISKEEAQVLVIEEHSGSIGKVEIKSIEIKNNKYIVEWENEENLEKGTDQVDKNGNLEIIEAEIE